MSSGVVRSHPHWLSQIQHVPTHYEQHLTVLFAGIGGIDRAVLEGGWQHKVVNAIEKRRSACKVLLSLHAKEAVLNCNVEDVELSLLKDSDGMVASPPCISFSSLGDHVGMACQDAQLWLKAIGVAKELASPERKRRLKWVIFGNVLRVEHDTKQGKAFDTIQAHWVEVMHGWTELHRWRGNARSAGLPQSRGRLFLVASEKAYSEIVGGVPPPPWLRKLDMVKLTDFLLPMVSCQDKPQPTEIQRQNILAFQTQYNKQSTCGDATTWRWTFLMTASALTRMKELMASIETIVKNDYWNRAEGRRHRALLAVGIANRTCNARTTTF